MEAERFFQLDEKLFREILNCYSPGDAIRRDEVYTGYMENICLDGSFFDVFAFFVSSGEKDYET